MPVSNFSQTGDASALMAALSKDILANLRVSMPGIIQSFDPGDEDRPPTCTVTPAIKAKQTDADGNETSVNYPELVDVPVVFPHGGGCSLTFPLTQGDECLLVFSDRCIDFWWQNGGIQEPVDPRQHDLSDAFAIPGPWSRQKKISDISTTEVQLRSDDGETSFSLNPISGSIAGVAPGGFDFNGLKISGAGKLTLVDGSVVDGHIHSGVEQGSSDTEPLSP